MNKDTINTLSSLQLLEDEFLDDERDTSEIEKSAAKFRNELEVEELDF